LHSVDQIAAHSPHLHATPSPSPHATPSTPLHPPQIGGALVGPYALNIISDVHQVQHLAELGVVFLLFTIGLELSLERLQSMAKYVFGMGAAQTVLTLLGVASVAMAVAGLPVPSAIILGGALAMSTTAVAIQVLEDRGEMGSRHGRATFSVLLFQVRGWGGRALLLFGAGEGAVGDSREREGGASLSPHERRRWFLLLVLLCRAYAVPPATHRPHATPPCAQDLAVVVLLMLIPLLAPDPVTGSSGGAEQIAQALGIAAVKAVVCIGGIIAGGRIFIRPL